MKHLFKWLIRLYAYVISPMTGANCRFFPTCSAYGFEAIDRFGAAKGAIMTAKRLCKCHPWHKGAWVDPVPASIDWGQILGYKRRTCACAQNNTDKAKDGNDA